MSFRVELDTSDYDLKFGLIRSGMPKLAPSIVSESADVIEKAMSEAVPVKTGTLKNSIRKDVLPLSAVISTNSGYGLFVDEDTGPHEIIAKGGFSPRGLPGSLRFEISGKTIFRRRIMHPGTKGQHFRLAAIEIFRNQFFDIVSTLWNKMRLGF